MAETAAAGRAGFAAPQAGRGATDLLHRRPVVAVAAALAAVLAVLPILSARYLPLLDVHGHESRVVALRAILLGGGSPFYGLDSLLLPNIGFDLVGVALAGWLSPEMTGRVFVAATTLLTLSGVLALNRVAVGRWSAAPLVAGLLLYNLFTLLGFLGYGLGIALLFWALAARLLLMRAAPAAQFAAGGAMAAGLLLCHLSAFAVYAVMLASIGLDRLLRARGPWRARSPVLLRVVLLGAETLPALALFALMSTGGEGRMHYDLPYLQTKLFSGLKSLTSGGMAADLAFAVGAVAALALLASCRRVRIARAFVPGLLVLTALYFAVPAHLSGGSYVDSRIPVVAALLAAAALDVELRAGRATLALLCVVAGAYATKQVALAVLWHEESQVLSGIAALFDGLPPGAVIVQAECVPDAGDVRAVYASRQPPLTHVAAFAAFTGERFAAATWTLKGQQPVRTLPAYLPYKAVQDAVGPSVCDPAGYRALLNRLRAAAAGQAVAGHAVPPLYVLLLRPPEAGTLGGAARLVAQTPELELYRASPE